MAGYPPGPPLRPDGGSSGAPGVLSTFVMVGWCQDRAGYYGRRPFLTRKKDPLHPGGPSPSVREGGVEPPRPFGHTDLNRARLPIPPLAPEADVRLSHVVSAAQTGRWRHKHDRYHRRTPGWGSPIRTPGGHLRGGTMSALQRF